MGTNVAPSLGSLVVGYLEETKLYPVLHEKQGEESASHVRDNFKRFLDDCFVFWPDILGPIDILIGTLNCMHQKLKCALVQSNYYS